MSRRTWIIVTVLTLSLFLASCGEYQLNWAPPLLMDTAGLSQQIDLDQATLSFGTEHNYEFSRHPPFTGHIFGAPGSSTVSMKVRAEGSNVAPGIALYGPRMQNGLFGAPITYNLPKRGVQAVLWSVTLIDEGDYLIIVKDAANVLGNYLVTVDCSDGCGILKCSPWSCGKYCATGFLRDNEGCLAACDCNAGCETHNDCPRDYVCENNVCVKEDPCPLCRDESYQPVCGVDGYTYANECELTCFGVAPDYAGECRQSECASHSDCPTGMLCENGVCVAACDCSGEPYYPVCGTDGVTYTNDCERQCAGVGLDHTGECESCNQEICDGQDNDCDGLIDEGVCKICTTDTECEQGEICLNGTCTKTLACSTNADCPVGQVCMSGLCQLEDGCEPEICDGADNDCDGQTDEGCPPQCESDSDCPAREACCANQCVDPLFDENHCGGCFAACAPGETCEQGVCVSGCTDADGDGHCIPNDCDDNDASIHPGAPEICSDRVDNNCNGLTEESCPCTTDADCFNGLICEDGLCTQMACGEDGDGDGFRDCDGDCDDADPNIYPGAVELCDLVDNDCDGQTDEACCECMSDADCSVGNACCTCMCVDLQTSKENCGSCGQACAAGEYCSNGACFTEGSCQTDADCDDGDPGTVDTCINETCVHRDACGTDSDCDTGYLCHQGECVLPCRTDPDCPHGETCQGGICAP